MPSSPTRLMVTEHPSAQLACTHRCACFRSLTLHRALCMSLRRQRAHLGCRCRRCSSCGSHGLENYSGHHFRCKTGASSRFLWPPVSSSAGADPDLDKATHNSCADSKIIASPRSLACMSVSHAAPSQLCYGQTMATASA